MMSTTNHIINRCTACLFCANVGLPRIFLDSVKFLLIYILTFLPCLILTDHRIYAADLPLTPDGTTNTIIDHAANGVPIVNIAAPNSSGLSHNRFSDFNVNQSGLILNNSIGSANDVVTTQLGGLIMDNRNLVGSGSAAVILNEVTSNNISQINGYQEIAGRKADYVLANPNGITVNNGGFINVDRVTMVVGSANQLNPSVNNLTFSLSNNAQVSNGFLPKLVIRHC